MSGFHSPTQEELMSLIFNPKTLLGSITQEHAPAPFPKATWYTGIKPLDGLAYSFPAGSLVEMRYLTADVLLDGNQLCTFLIVLQEGDEGPQFTLSQGFLNQCQGRIRLPLEAVNQNRWRYDREGAWLKPRCGGQRVDLSKVDRMRFEIERMPYSAAGPLPVRWCMTPFTATIREPSRLKKPFLPKGPLLDKLGQSTLHQWPGKSRTAKEVSECLRAQLAGAYAHHYPDSWSRWGGWKGKQLEATGFFRVAQADGRWWLVDPQGCVFWSSGLDCVGVDTVACYSGLESALAWMPDPQGLYHEIYTERQSKIPHINYLASNLIRTFGKGWHTKWAQITLGELRRLGFNTIGNWSEWQIARQSGVPYTRPLRPNYEQMPLVYRDFPDVFHPDFNKVCADFASQLEETRDDPAFIGYFLMNEPTWGFAEETPAAGMLFNTLACHTRTALSQFLHERYGADTALSSAWGLRATLRQIAEGEWLQALTPQANADLADFSAIMVNRFFSGLSNACKAVDSHHLNLGIRYYTVPPAWALDGMRHFDVFSMNCYRQKLPAAEMAHISESLNQPILIGEWHFGALDVGLPASGIGHVPTQEDRGKAFRLYVEDAAAKPWCVGTHYFILYDQSALGRFDGENYNIGFLDVCNRPYEPLAAAARLSHERLYAVATGEVAPFDDALEYLPMLFM
jgi:hypothetical protein